MKTIIIVLFLIFIGLFFSCQSINGPVNLNTFIPLNIGNYWVYEVNSKDSIKGNFNSHIDSMVVIGTTKDSVGDFFVLLYFRDGFIYDTMKMKYNSSNLVSYTKLFYPFIPLDTSGCQTTSPKHFLQLGFTNKNNIHVRDSFPGDDYTTLVPDPNSDSGLVNVRTVTAHIWDYDIIKTDDINIYLNDEKYDATLFAFNGKEYYKMISPEKAQFVSNDKCELLDNNRTIIRFSFYLNLYYQEGIGLIQSSGVMNRCNELFSEHTRKLLRYKIK